MHRSSVDLAAAQQRLREDELVEIEGVPVTSGVRTPLDLARSLPHGSVRYGRPLRPGQEPGDAVVEEKRRADAVRDDGWGVLREGWSDLEVPPVRHSRTASTGTRRTGRR